MLRITDFVGVGDSEVVAMSVESMSLRRRVPSRLARVGLARHFPSLGLLLLFPFPFLPFLRFFFWGGGLSN